MATARKRRQNLSISEKVKLLDRLNAGESRQRIVEETGIGLRTIERMVASEEDIRMNASTSTPSVKRKRTGKHEDVDAALGAWFTSVRNQKQIVTGPMLMQKSKDFAEQLGTDFSPSVGWLVRWKARMGIKFKRAHGEKNSADVSAAERWSTDRVPEILEAFEEEDIYNADETGLFYRATPDATLCFAKEQLYGSKKALDRITVLVCANMTGTDKRKLLVIGKSKNPRCFKGVDIARLPIIYRSNKKAWMTGALFTEWLTEWDRELRNAGRKILLLIDNCSAHPALDSLTNICLEFLPPNTTSMIQPMDQGVIRNLKVHYRRELVNLTLSHIEQGLLLPNATATDVSSKVTVLDAIQFVAKSWRLVQAATVQGCFKHAGLQSRQPTEAADADSEEAEEAEEADETFLTMQGEADADCRGDEQTDEEIVEAVQEKKRLKLGEDVFEAEGEEEEEEEDFRDVCVKDAKGAIETLCRFATLHGFDEKTLQKLDDVGAAVNKAALSSMRQATITTFFHSS